MLFKFKTEVINGKVYFDAETVHKSLSYALNVLKDQGYPASRVAENKANLDIMAKFIKEIEKNG